MAGITVPLRFIQNWPHFSIHRRLVFRCKHSSHGEIISRSVSSPEVGTLNHTPGRHKHSHHRTQQVLEVTQQVSWDPSYPTPRGLQAAEVTHSQRTFAQVILFSPVVSTVLIDCNLKHSENTDLNIVTLLYITIDY